LSRPSDTEYKLRRQIKDLEDKNLRLEQEIAQLKKKLERELPPVEKKKKKGTEPECPLCGAAVKSTALPFGTLQLCSAGCGYRHTKRSNG
jgi:hypothetical protein